MTIKEKILQFVDYKGLSNRKFSIEINVSHMYFSKKGAVGSDVLEKIFTMYPELNFDWLITGRGEMLMSENSKKCANCEDFKEKYYSLLEKNQVLQEEAITYLKQKEIIINQQ